MTGDKATERKFSEETPPEKLANPDLWIVDGEDTITYGEVQMLLENETWMCLSEEKRQGFELASASLPWSSSNSGPGWSRLALCPDARSGEGHS